MDMNNYPIKPSNINLNLNPNLNSYNHDAIRQSNNSSVSSQNLIQNNPANTTTNILSPDQNIHQQTQQQQPYHYPTQYQSFTSHPSHPPHQPHFQHYPPPHQTYQTYQPYQTSQYPPQYQFQNISNSPMTPQLKHNNSDTSINNSINTNNNNNNNTNTNSSTNNNYPFITSNYSQSHIPYQYQYQYQNIYPNIYHNQSNSIPNTPNSIQIHSSLPSSKPSNDQNIEEFNEHSSSNLNSNLNLNSSINPSSKPSASSTTATSISNTSNNININNSNSNNNNNNNINVKSENISYLPPFQDLNSSIDNNNNDTTTITAPNIISNSDISNEKGSVSSSINQPPKKIQPPYNNYPTQPQYQYTIQTQPQQSQYQPQYQYQYHGSPTPLPPPPPQQYQYQPPLLTQQSSQAPQAPPPPPQQQQYYRTSDQLPIQAPHHLSQVQSQPHGGYYTDGYNNVSYHLIPTNDQIEINRGLKRSYDSNGNNGNNNNNYHSYNNPNINKQNAIAGVIYNSSAVFKRLKPCINEEKSENLKHYETNRTQGRPFSRNLSGRFILHENLKSLLNQVDKRSNNKFLVYDFKNNNKRNYNTINRNNPINEILIENLKSCINNNNSNDLTNNRMNIINENFNEMEIKVDEVNNFLNCSNDEILLIDGYKEKFNQKQIMINYKWKKDNKITNSNNNNKKEEEDDEYDEYEVKDEENVEISKGENFHLLIKKNFKLKEYVFVKTIRDNNGHILKLETVKPPINKYGKLEYTSEWLKRRICYPRYKGGMNFHILKSNFNFVLYNDLKMLLWDIKEEIIIDNSEEKENGRRSNDNNSTSNKMNDRDVIKEEKKINNNKNGDNNNNTGTDKIKSIIKMNKPVVDNEIKDKLFKNRILYIQMFNL